MMNISTFAPIMKISFRSILTFISLFVQEILFSQSLNLADHHKLISSRDMLGYDLHQKIKSGKDNKTIGLIAKALKDPKSLDSLIASIPKKSKVQMGCNSISPKKWRAIFYEGSVDGEMFWSLVDDTENSYGEYLELWEGGYRVRTILIIRNYENNLILGVIDIDS
jgi:hypothetical protein